MVAWPVVDLAICGDVGGCSGGVFTVGFTMCGAGQAAGEGLVEVEVEDWRWVTADWVSSVVLYLAT